jgi:PAS domain S-box-containing protein
MRVEAQGTRSPSVVPIKRSSVVKRGAPVASAAEPTDVVLSREFLHATLDSLPANIAVLDEHGEIIMTNRAWSMFALANGGAAPPGLGVNYLAVCDAVDDDRLPAHVGAGLRGIIAGTSTELTTEYACNGPTAERWFGIRATRYEGPGPARVVVTHDEITSYRAAQAEVAIQAALLDEVDVSVIATGTDGLVTYWSRGAEHLYGWTAAEAVGRGAELIVSPDAGFTEEARAELRRDGRWEGRFPVARKDGSTFPASVRVLTMEADDGTPSGMIGVSTDMTERVECESALLTAKNYMSAIADSMGEGLFTIDPAGHFIYMNRAAERLLGWSTWELHGRVIHEVVHSRNPDGTARRIEDCQIFRAQRDGVTVSVEDDVFTRRDGLILAVDYTASPFTTDDGVEGCAIVFEDITDRKTQQQTLEHDVETLSWVGRVKDALAEDQFVLYAQPIIDVRSGEVVQRELLLRMLGEDGEILAPGHFLPVAEKYGLIGDIDRWVIEHAIEIAAAGTPVQINLSARSVGDPAVLEIIERCVERTGADPGCLVFEITETALIAGDVNARAFADRLRALGCGLALDDFGTGYGGLTYLKQLPIDFLKIDIEFVRDITTNPASRHVVEAVVALGAAFDLQTVGEGVEDAETLELLRDLGVDFAQGYHIARPGPLDA